MHTPLHVRRSSLTAALFFLVEDNNAVLFSEVATAGKLNAGRTSRALEKTGSVSFAAALSLHSSSSSRVPGQLMTSKVRVTRSEQVL